MMAGGVPRGEEWLFGIKWDGVRAVAFLDNEEVRLQARSGLRCERQYPELAVLPHQVAAGRAILDGEIAVGQPRSDHGLGHHAHEQDLLTGHRSGEVEEPVQQIATEHVAGHVLGRRHPLEWCVRKKLAGEQILARHHA